MEKLSLFLLIMLLLWIDPWCSAQTSVQVTDPRLELRDNVIHISYDILNSKSSDYFEIGVDISDVQGREILASALNGDIGTGVSGGSNKYIQWDLEADGIIMDENIYFEIVARTMPQTELVLIGRKDNSDQMEGKTILSTKVSPVTSISKSYSSAGIVFQSMLIPGLGLSRVTGNPHWIRGLTGYGLITGSFIMNRKSFNTFKGIDDYIDFNDRVDQFQKSITQDDISEVLAYAAIGIWASDIIWTLVGISSFKKRVSLGAVNGLSVRPGIDPKTYAPTVGIKYSF